jgi:hypothetical protein
MVDNSSSGSWGGGSKLFSFLQFFMKEFWQLVARVKVCISEMMIVVTYCTSSVKDSQFFFFKRVRKSAKLMYSASGFLILSLSHSCRSICSGHKRSSRNESEK